ISFDGTVFATPQTISLSNGQLNITSEITITGPGVDLLTIDAQGNSRIFSVNGSGNATISGMTITGGVSGAGGGIFNSGDLVVANVVVTGNSTAPTSGENGGGGIHSQNGSLVVRNSTVSGNSFSSRTIQTGGGGINVRSGTALIDGTTISNNSVNANISNSDKYGGGVSVQNSATVTITGSTISGNSGRVRGGGVFTRGTLTIVDSTISGNTTSNRGGGLYEQFTASGDTIVVNSTFSGNQASEGGGIYADSGATLRNVSVIDNVATGSRGGGILVRATNDITMYNTLIAANTLNDGTVNDVQVRDGEGITAQSSHNLIAGGDLSLVNITHGVNGNIIGDGQGNDLDPATIVETFLLDNGGSTLTHTLVPGSPALDAGDNSEAVGTDGNPLSFDQRGASFSRVFDGDGNQTATVDIGAVEVDSILRLPMTFVVDTLVDESDGDFSAGDLSLREAIELSNSAVAVDSITFDSALFAGGSQTLDLTLGELSISEEVTITGPGADQLTIDAQQNSRIFYVDSSVQDATISGLTLTNGRANQGGAIRNDGTLTVIESYIHGNVATGYGGAIENKGDLNIYDSTIANNSTRIEGGGIDIYLDGPRATASLTLVNSTVSGNSAGEDGGGIFRNKSAAVN
ncbi:MAG: right-handed parallel beta-helix repeat-containing protein, partial [Planctomycetaceae bacterium]|nr:right-handed parallel beta-helix repeat-containing protein [Planctomycetaceae bacterium]